MILRHFTSIMALITEADKLFLHIGGGKFLRAKDIIGFFDIETSTQSTSTKDFLKESENQGIVRTICTDLPKSFILSVPRKDRQKPKRLYISASAVKTLKNRSLLY